MIFYNSGRHFPYTVSCSIGLVFKVRSLNACPPYSQEAILRFLRGQLPNIGKFVHPAAVLGGYPVTSSCGNSLLRTEDNEGDDHERERHTDVAHPSLHPSVRILSPMFSGRGVRPSVRPSVRPFRRFILIDRVIQ